MKTFSDLYDEVRPMALDLLDQRTTDGQPVPGSAYAAAMVLYTRAAAAGGLIQGAIASVTGEQPQRAAIQGEVVDPTPTAVLPVMGGLRHALARNRRQRVSPA